MVVISAIRAGFWRRAAAVLLDFCIGVVPAYVLAAVAATYLESSGRRLPLTDYLLSIALCTAILGYTSFEVFKAATPGKMILRLFIAGAGGQSADRWTLALRWSTKFSPLLMGLIHCVTLDTLSGFLTSLMTWVVLLGCLPALGEEKRTWHDEWSGTAVFRRRPLELHSPAPAPTIP